MNWLLKLIGIAQPVYCPVCGRKLIAYEVVLRYSAQTGQPVKVQVVLKCPDGHMHKTWVERRKS